MKKKSLTLIAFVVVIAALAGCQQKNDNTSMNNDTTNSMSTNSMSTNSMTSTNR